MQKVRFQSLGWEDTIEEKMATCSSLLAWKIPWTEEPMQENLGSIPGLGRLPGGGHDNPLQYSCLENSMDRGIWWATVHRVTKSWT